MFSISGFQLLLGRAQGTVVQQLQQGRGNEQPRLIRDSKASTEWRVHPDDYQATTKVAE